MKGQKTLNELNNKIQTLRDSFDTSDEVYIELNNIVEYLIEITEYMNSLVKVSYEDSFRESNHDKSLELHDKAVIREEFSKKVIGE